MNTSDYGFRVCSSTRVLSFSSPLIPKFYIASRPNQTVELVNPTSGLRLQTHRKNRAVFSRRHNLYHRNVTGIECRSESFNNHVLATKIANNTFFKFLERVKKHGEWLNNVFLLLIFLGLTKEVVSIYGENFETPESREPYFITIHRCVKQCDKAQLPKATSWKEIEIVVPDINNHTKFYKYVVNNHTTCGCGDTEQKLHKKLVSNEGKHSNNSYY